MRSYSTPLWLLESLGLYLPVWTNGSGRKPGFGGLGLKRSETHCVRFLDLPKGGNFDLL